MNATIEGSGTHTLQGFSSKTYTRQRYLQTAQQPIQVSGIRSRRHDGDAWSCWTNKVQKNFFNNLCSFNGNRALGIKIQTWHLLLRRVTATRVEFTLLAVLSLGVQWGTVHWGERIPVFQQWLPGRGRASPMPSWWSCTRSSQRWGWPPFRLRRELCFWSRCDLYRSPRLQRPFKTIF